MYSAPQSLTACAAFHSVAPLRSASFATLAGTPFVSFVASWLATLARAPCLLRFSGARAIASPFSRPHLRPFCHSAHGLSRLRFATPPTLRAAFVRAWFGVGGLRHTSRGSSIHFRFALVHSGLTRKALRASSCGRYVRAASGRHLQCIWKAWVRIALDSVVKSRAALRSAMPQLRRSGRHPIT